MRASRSKFALDMKKDTLRLFYLPRKIKPPTSELIHCKTIQGMICQKSINANPQEKFTLILKCLSQRLIKLQTMDIC